MTDTSPHGSCEGLSESDRKLMGSPEDAALALERRAAEWRVFRQPRMDTAAGHKKHDAQEREALFRLGNAALLWLWHQENALAQARPSPPGPDARELPDLLWDAENPEHGGLDEWEIVDGYDPGTVVRLQCARSMPDMWAVRIPGADEDDTCPLFKTREEAEAAYAAALRTSEEGAGRE